MYTVSNFGIQNILGAPLGLPPGIPTQTFAALGNPVPPPEIPGQGLKRALCYLADYGGCGFYRGIAPNLMLNLLEQAVVQESTTMILDPNYYQTVETVKVQRQATPHQKEFIKFLKQISTQKPLKLMYEVDDVVFGEDIPLYNRNREAFTSPEIRNSIIEIMSMMDEITVTSEYDRAWYIVTGKQIGRAHV